ncbi:MAG TPA: hypothetical protein PLC79_08795, partial [Phycisphaerae bacterium]|nr:hypothetical protein [Phycisphaerae bacterium]
TAAQILAANNINKFTIRSDFSEVISQPIIRGDVMKWEITTELLPGWLPDPHLDDVAPENVENEVTYASIHLAPGMSEEEIAADPWYAAYHRRGSEFHLHQEVGRRWVLNETHRYFGDYARTTVFDADKYRGWEPSDCNITEEYVTAAGDIATRPVPAGSWARIGRPLDDCLSADREGRSLGVYIEFSFDGGTTWRRMTGTAARALESEAGIYLECDDLMTLMPDGGDVSVWEALVRGRLRVRVTAVIAGDARLTPNIDAERFGPPTTSGCSRVFNVADRYHWASRQLANSQFRIGGPKEVAYQTTECRSDLAELQAFAGNVMAICTARQMPATLTIPWLATTDFSVGDCITGISGLGITFWTSSLGGSRHPDIVGMVFGNTETRLILEDRRLADVVLA